MITPVKPIENQKLPSILIRITSERKLEVSGAIPSDMLVVYDMLHGAASVIRQSHEQKSRQQQPIIQASSDALKQLDELKRLREGGKNG